MTLRSWLDDPESLRAEIANNRRRAVARDAEWERVVREVRNGLPLKHPTALEDFDEILKRMGVP